MSFVVPYLFGSAATATTAATTGLIGTAGSFALAPTLTTLGTAALVSGAMKQGQSQSQAANFNAETAKQEAVVQEAVQRQEAKRTLGTIRANIAKSGAAFEGTPLMVLAESAANAEIDALNTAWSADRETALYKMRAREARETSYYRAGTSLLTGLGSLSALR